MPLEQNPTTIHLKKMRAQVEQRQRLQQQQQQQQQQNQSHSSAAATTTNTNNHCSNNTTQQQQQHRSQSTNARNTNMMNNSNNGMNIIKPKKTKFLDILNNSSKNDSQQQQPLQQQQQGLSSNEVVVVAPPPQPQHQPQPPQPNRISQLSYGTSGKQTNLAPSGSGIASSPQINSAHQPFVGGNRPFDRQHHHQNPETTKPKNGKVGNDGFRENQKVASIFKQKPAFQQQQQQQSRLPKTNHNSNNNSSNTNNLDTTNMISDTTDNNIIDENNTTTTLLPSPGSLGGQSVSKNRLVQEWEEAGRNSTNDIDYIKEKGSQLRRERREAGEQAGSSSLSSSPRPATASQQEERLSGGGGRRLFQDHAPLEKINNTNDRHHQNHNKNDNSDDNTSDDGYDPLKGVAEEGYEALLNPLSQEEAEQLVRDDMHERREEEMALNVCTQTQVGPMADEPYRRRVRDDEIDVDNDVMNLDNDAVASGEEENNGENVGRISLNETQESQQQNKKDANNNNNDNKNTDEDAAPQQQPENNNSKNAAAAEEDDDDEDACGAEQFVMSLQVDTSKLEQNAKNNMANFKPGKYNSRNNAKTVLPKDDASSNNNNNQQNTIHHHKSQAEQDFYGLPKKFQELFRKNNITKLHPWQEEVLNMNSVRQYKNIVYSQPTSGGKTLVAEICMLRCVHMRKKHAIFVLPFVALVNEKFAALRYFAENIGFGIEAYYQSNGRFPVPSEPSILICTTEKANQVVNSLLEKTNPLVSDDDRFNEIGCVVVDEVHMVKDPKRGVVLEILLTKIKTLSDRYKNDLRRQIIRHMKKHGNRVNGTCGGISPHKVIDYFDDKTSPTYEADRAFLRERIEEYDKMKNTSWSKNVTPQANNNNNNVLEDDATTPSSNGDISPRSSSNTASSLQEQDHGFVAAEGVRLERHLLEAGCQIVAMSATIPNLHLIAEWLGAHCYIGSYRPCPLTLYYVVAEDRTVYQQFKKVTKKEFDDMYQVEVRKKKREHEVMLNRLRRAGGLPAAVDSDNAGAAASSPGRDTLLLTDEQIAASISLTFQPGEVAPWKRHLYHRSSNNNNKNEENPDAAAATDSGNTSNNNSTSSLISSSGSPSFCSPTTQQQEEQQRLLLINPETIKGIPNPDPTVFSSIEKQDEESAILVNKRLQLAQGNLTDRFLQVILRATDIEEEKRQYESYYQEVKNKIANNDNETNNNNNAASPPSNLAASSGFKQASSILAHGKNKDDQQQQQQPQPRLFPQITEDVPDHVTKRFITDIPMRRQIPSMDFSPNAWPDEQVRTLFKLNTLTDAFNATDTIMETWATQKSLSFVGPRNPDHKVHYHSAMMSHHTPSLFLTRFCQLVPEPRHRSTLIFCSSKKSCQHEAQMLLDFFKSVKWKGTGIIMTNKNNKNNSIDAPDIEKDRSRQLYYAFKDIPKTSLGDHHHQLTEMMHFGIAFHHSSLSPEERKIVEKLFKEQKIFYLFCTSTLATGVNLPARRVVIKEPKIGLDFLPKSTFLQMCGRAGRKGFDTYGECFLWSSKNHAARAEQDLLFGPLKPTISAIQEEAGGFSRALLELIVNEIAASREELFEFAKKFFYFYSRFFKKIAVKRKNNNNTCTSSTNNVVDQQVLNQQSALDRKWVMIRSVIEDDTPPAMYDEVFDEKKVDVKSFQRVFDEAFEALAEVNFIETREIVVEKKFEITSTEEILKRTKELVATTSQPAENGQTNKSNTQDAAEDGIADDSDDVPLLEDTDDDVPENQKEDADNNDRIAEENINNKKKNAPSALKSKTKDMFTEIRKVVESIEIKPTPFGKCAVKALLPIPTARQIRQELESVQVEGLILANELHICYFLTPPAEVETTGKYPWDKFSTLLEREITNDHPSRGGTGALEKICDRLMINRCALNQAKDTGGTTISFYDPPSPLRKRLPPLDHIADPEERKQIQERIIAREAMKAKEMRKNEVEATFRHVRFMLAMVLKEILNEVPLDEVSRKYDISYNTATALQQNAGAFAHQMVSFCQQLDWYSLAATFESFVKRLSYGVKPDLVPLMEIENVSSAKARMLWNAGLKTVAQIAQMSDDDIYHAVQKLREGISTSSATSGSGNGVNHAALGREMMIKRFMRTSATALRRNAIHLLQKQGAELSNEGKEILKRAEEKKMNNKNGTNSHHASSTTQLGASGSPFFGTSAVTPRLSHPTMMTRQQQQLSSASGNATRWRK